jgi:hypothetical protein
MDLLGGGHHLSDSAVAPARFPAGQLGNRFNAPLQRRRWLGPARDGRCREDLRDVAEGPANLSCRLPVVEDDWKGGRLAVEPITTARHSLRH